MSLEYIVLTTFYVVRKRLAWLLDLFDEKECFCLST